VKEGEVAPLFQPLPDRVAHFLGRHLCDMADAVIEARIRLKSLGLTDYV
jgi:hypothetical protein